jgi:signal transduction histidine kinase
MLHAAAAAAASAGVLVAGGLPLAARHALSGVVYLTLVFGASIVAVALGAVLLFRSVARPLERLLGAAEQLAGIDSGGLPILGEPGGQALSRAAVAFERVALALAEERGRLAAKVEELTKANRALAEARESLLRSEKLATVGRLASGVAHEVGNPLGAVSGYLGIARDRLRDGRVGELDDYLGRIDAELRRIDRTVRDLLDFARPAKPSLTPIDLASAIDASLRVARVQTRFKGVEVELDLPPELPKVLADEHTLAQVLVNLFLNAGDALGGRGGVRVTARAGPDQVVARMEDNGPGIAPADLPRVFDPFFTTKEPGQGTGLGLAICHRIMESYGGEIAAGNAPGGGAVFTLTFRAASAGLESP